MKITIDIPLPIITFLNDMEMPDEKIKEVYKEFVNHCVSNYFGDTDEMFENWYNEEYN